MTEGLPRPQHSGLSSPLSQSRQNLRHKRWAGGGEREAMQPGAADGLAAATGDVLNSTFLTFKGGHMSGSFQALPQTALRQMV